MDKILVQKGDKKINVTEKAFRVVYKDMGFKEVEEVTPADGQDGETEVDFFELSEEELKKINNDDLKAYLDKEEIEYGPKATKDELIEIIKG
ncbi:hypothetical protein [Salipaludibacillus sp. CF4.18]|uniref:hypothetical protein n=1 Tax=Salipaludibacillus sp. CF4.18 TaxID=3373081 RepID=UPI003EE72831